MAKFKIEHKGNYSVIANSVFKDTRLSWKAKGILANMLSLPDNWDYSMAGLEKLASDGLSATRTALKELEQFGYLVRKQIRGERGVFIDWEYIIREAPLCDFPQVDNPQVDKPQVDNHTQLNTNNINKTNNKVINNKERKKPASDYDNIINSNIKDESVRNALLEFIKMRKLAKSPMTNRALELLISRLRKLADTPEMAVKVLEQSIVNNWKNVYELKENKEIRHNVEGYNGEYAGFV